MSKFQIKAQRAATTIATAAVLAAGLMTATSSSAAKRDAYWSARRAGSEPS